MARFSIGEMAKRAGVGIDTVRYYERTHLLPAANRLASGYRQYDSTDVQRLSFIRHAKELGFTLDEIRELLALSTDRERGVRGVKTSAEAQLADLDHRIREMQRVRRGLQRLIASCPGQGTLEQCPILGALTRKENS